MRALWLIGAGAAVFAGAAQADGLEIEHAAARVIVIPEARRDVSVTITPGAAKLPALTVRREGRSVEVKGGLRNKIKSCDVRGVGLVRDTGTPLRPDSQASVDVRGFGRINVADLPLITARVPMEAEVSASGAVWGSIGRTASLELSSATCGRWNVANVSGPLELSFAGSGDVVAGAVRRAEVNLAGSGDIRVGTVAETLSANIAGSGNIIAASVGGSIEAAIAGSGDIVVEGGRSGPLDASIMGSGDVRVDGEVARLDAAIAGSGDIRVASVAGEVERSVMGSGEVVVGGQSLPRRR